MKKLKDIVKNNPEPARGKIVDPWDPWSAKANLAEDSLLHRYLLSRGINPRFVSKDTKISHAKSLAFQKWKINHQNEEVEIDETMTMQHSPYELRQHALKKSQHMHKVKPSGIVANGLHKEESEQLDELSPSTLASYVLKTTSKDPKRAEPRKKATSKLAKAMAKQPVDPKAPRYSTKLFGEGFDDHEEIAKELIRRHGMNITKDHLKALENERDSRSALDHDAVMNKIRAMGAMTEAKKPTALEKFRKAAAEREKKHAEIEKKQSKDGSGMTSAIDRLEKHINKEAVDAGVSKAKETSFHKKLDKLVHSTFGKRKDEMKKEEVEQIDEISKSTLTSYRQKSMASLKTAKTNRSAAEFGKDMSKGFADLHAKSDAIAKKRVKGLAGYLQRKHGMKPGYSDERKTTSEDVYHDTYAATQMPFDGANNTNDVSPKKREMSKSARIIKSIYKRKNMKEETYDWEKDDKAQQPSLGKKPKIEKTDEKESYGENKPEARIIMSGGKTMTGEPRDTVEIDPSMKNRPGPDAFEKNGKKSPNP